MHYTFKDRFISGCMSFVIAVVVALSSALPNIFYSQTVMAATVPPVQDSASAVNYATILGRATDFGIVANEFHHENHMETTIAVNDYYQINSNVTDVDFVSGTAQFIVAHVKEGYFALGSKQAATTYNIEASEELYYAVNENAADSPTFVYPIPENNNSTKGKGYVGFFWIDYDFKSDNTKTLDVYPVATSTVENNVNRIIENMQEKSAEIDMKANDPGYAVNYQDYKTADSEFVLDFIQNGNVFANKVIYINVDSNLASQIGEGKLHIKKDASTVICFNYPETGAEIKVGRIYVWDNQENMWVSSVTGSSGETTAEGHTNDQTDELINQKIVFNLQTTGKVTLDAAGGTFLVPKASSNTEVVGSSTGWIVTAGSMVNHAEWHYIYKAVSQESMKDGVGQIHFAARKAFTHDYDGKNTLEDKTVFCSKDDFTFAWYETDSSYSITGLSPIDNPKNQATNTIKFPTLTFYTDATKANGDTDHLVLEGQSKDFYYKVIETSSEISSINGKPVSVSSGCINIHLTVTNIGGFLSYTVSSETRLGDNSIYKKNSNVGMSGVEFNLGAFFNLIEDQNKTAIDIVKQDETGTALPGARFVLTGKTDSNDDIIFNPSQIVLGEGAKCISTSTSIEFVTGNELTTIKHLDDGTYTLEEVGAPYGYTVAPVYTFKVESGVVTLISPSNGTTEADGSSFTSAAGSDNAKFTLVDKKDSSTVKYTSVEISKVITGTGTELKGAKLTLTGKLDNGNDVVFKKDQFSGASDAQYVSDGDSLTFISGSDTSIIMDLPDGTYTLHEEVAPSGYAVATDITFTITDGVVSGTTVKTSTVAARKVVMEDDVYLNTIKFAKKDATNNSVRIADVSLELTGLSTDGTTPINFTGVSVTGAKSSDTSDTSVLKFVTDTQDISIADLPNGTYTLTETSCPGNYKIASSPVSFVVADGVITTQSGILSASGSNLVMYDESNSTGTISQVYFRKLNTSGAFVSGATITITGKYSTGASVNLSGVTVTGAVKSSSTVDSVTFETGNDYVYINNLPQGAVYTFVETNTPANYLTATSVTFKENTQSEGVEPNGFNGGNYVWISSPRITMKDADASNAGKIVINKTIDGAGLSDLGSITFTVNGPDDYNRVITVDAASWDENGNTYTYTLTDGIVAGADYTVIESNNGSNSKYELTASTVNPATGKVTAADVNSSTEATVGFTNTYSMIPGSLKITKSFVGAELDSITGSIQITIKDSSDTAVKTVYLSADNTTDWKYENGAYVCTISNLPAGTYTVEETETANAITTKIDGSEQTSKDVTVNSGSVASVAVTNNYSTTQPTVT
ncbi:MAG: DUF5979 domain-containing protein, partial [Saccharofermentans sp.]|nr:DUF5979 domain-containing protein [Saccharofermentans sp.]